MTNTVPPLWGGSPSTSTSCTSVRRRDFGGHRKYNPDDAAAAHDCVLRIKAGERSFDPEYFLDLTELTGAQAIYGTARR